MSISDKSYFTCRAEWRAWLEEHHDSEPVLWLVFYKKGTGRPTLTYEEAVGEALCFGWIDSTIRSLDEESYVRQFTPRKKRSNWSEINLIRVRKLMEQGRMTDAGLKKLEGSDLSKLPDKKKPRKPLTVPDWLEEGIRAYPNAWETFGKLTPTQKRHYVGWISSAKHEETRERRMKEAIGYLSEGKKMPMK